MLFGFAAFAELPFSTAGPDNSLTITASANTLAISIGNPGISADSVLMRSKCADCAWHFLL